MHENILVERVYAFFLKLYIENKNKYCFTQIPELYVNEKIEEYNEQFQKTMQDRKNKVKKQRKVVVNTNYIDFAILSSVYAICIIVDFRVK